MSDRNIFLTLTPADDQGLAADAFRLQHNEARYTRPSTFDDGPSRETTPGDSFNENLNDELEYVHRIHLRFDQNTKLKGRVTFGSDPDRSDVLLTPKRRQHGISGLHFYITFDNQNRPVVRDTSKKGLTVSYDGQAVDERRRHFQWIIFPGYKQVRITSPQEQHVRLAFDAHRPHYYETYPQDYEKNVKRFMVDAPQEHEVAFVDLALHSQSTSFAPSESLSPNKRPVYLEQNRLGKGAFGCVWKVVNASTGLEYAGKEYFHKKGWEKEIQIMRQLYHDHIVQFIDFRTAPKPLLVMEYLPLGNLETQHKASSISDDEMMIVFHQCLESLSYLHGQNITHRDLKPENMLLRSRTPIHVKLADFGLSQDKTDLTTFCGSPVYAAPEIFHGQPYTNDVDTWSLAVIVMQYIYGLPQYRQAGTRKRGIQSWGLAWCQLLLDNAHDWDSDYVIDFLTNHMLRWEAQERLSAAECLKNARNIGLFDGSAEQTGSVTPRLQLDRDLPNSTTDEASTPLIGPLWQDVRSPRGKEGMSLSQDFSLPADPDREQQPSYAIMGNARNERSSDSSTRASRLTKRRRIMDQSQCPSIDDLGSCEDMRSSGLLKSGFIKSGPAVAEGHFIRQNAALQDTEESGVFVTTL